MLGSGCVARLTGGDVWSLAECPHYPGRGVGTTSVGDRVEGGGGALINPLPTAYHEHRPSESNSLIDT